MTQEEIIEMAKQAGAMFDHMTWVERDLLPVFECFAELVAEKEREACAKLCEKQMEGKSIWIEGSRACSIAIRARVQE